MLLKYKQENKMMKKRKKLRINVVQFDGLYSQRKSNIWVHIIIFYDNLKTTVTHGITNP